MLPATLAHGMRDPECCFVQIVSAQSNDVDDNSAGLMRATAESSKVLWTIPGCFPLPVDFEVVSRTVGGIDQVGALLGTFGYFGARFSPFQGGDEVSLVGKGFLFRCEQVVIGDGPAPVGRRAMISTLGRLPYVALSPAILGPKPRGSYRIYFLRREGITYWHPPWRPQCRPHPPTPAPGPGLTPLHGSV